MKLHENNEEFRAAILGTSNQTGAPVHVVEKDYWVTKLLYNLSNYEHRRHVIFKGGTSLSKGYRLMQRFSEDIDLAVHPEGLPKIHKRPGDALYTIIKKIKDPLFAKVEGEGDSEPKRYKRVYSFPKSFDYPPDSPIHGKIVLELNAFSVPTPTEPVTIRTLVSERLEADGHDLTELGLQPFTIEALIPERTFCEKLLALRRACHKGGAFFSDRIRHVYDIHALYQSARVRQWIDDPKAFPALLEHCHIDDEMNQKISAEHAPDFNSYRIFSSPVDRINEVKTSYDKLKDITFDKKVPPIDEVAQSLTEISRRLQGFRFDVPKP